MEALIVSGVRFQRVVRPYLSAEILQDYVEVPALPKFAFSSDEIEPLTACCEARERRCAESPCHSS
jgi:hypothetical protein